MHSITLANAIFPSAGSALRMVYTVNVCTAGRLICKGTGASIGVRFEYQIHSFILSWERVDRHASRILRV